MGQSGCNILIRYMALLFVPIGVGVMQVLGSAARSAGAGRYLLRHQHALVVFVVVSWTLTVHGERKVIGQREKKK